MKLEQSFEVQAPLQRVWEALIDVERVAPCLPGASVTGRNPDGSYNGEFKVKIGPTSAAYSGKLHMEDIDEARHSAVMQAAGTDKRGQGGAKATIVSSVAEAAGGATTVNVNTDYHITGRLARFGRGGMIEEISNRLLGEFASSLQGMLAGSGDGPPVVETRAEPAPEPAPAHAPAEPSAFASAGNGGAAASPPPPPPPGESLAPPPPGPPEPLAPPPADPVAPPTPPTAGPAVEGEPLDAVSLVRAVVVKKVRTNPAPFVAAAVGLVVALRVFRRRR
ncbi:MAG TPA: SRPBCC family protein [Solirubrobacteraceae bacterium]|jgi:carbon monoxide dehydrogenase subunit G|nr:SRPBCC family protein [Solirubrobacteraceae bacterium]